MNVFKARNKQVKVVSQKMSSSGNRLMQGKWNVKLFFPLSMNPLTCFVVIDFLILISLELKW